MNLFHFFILTLAIWRLSSLAVNEDGPHKVFERTRNWSIDYTELLTCVWCTSIWIAGFIVIFYLASPFLTLVICLPFALSAGAILIDRISQ